MLLSSSASSGEHLQLVIDNFNDGFGTTEIHVNTLSPLGTTELIFTGPVLEPFGTIQLPLSVDSLSLPSEGLAFSGQIRIKAAMLRSEGREFAEQDIILFFHRDTHVTLVYDREARDRIWNGGALTERTATERSQASALERERDNIRVEYNPNVSSKKISSSTSYVPPADGDADE